MLHLRSPPDVFLIITNIHRWISICVWDSFLTKKLTCPQHSTMFYYVVLWQCEFFASHTVHPSSAFRKDKQHRKKVKFIEMNTWWGSCLVCWVWPLPSQTSQPSGSWTFSGHYLLNYRKPVLKVLCIAIHFNLFIKIYVQWDDSGANKV